MKVALFTKENKPGVNEVIRYAKRHFSGVKVYMGERGNAFPRAAEKISADILISYLSPWIIPRSILKKTRYWNINFHPGPPEYPGIGCYNFAIYDNKISYGVTAHLMEEKVDSGKIIWVKKFPLAKTDSVYSLSLKSYKHLLLLFYRVMDAILKNNRLPESDYKWQRKPYTRKELETLCKIYRNMTKDEMRRRIKAVTYPDMPGAYVDIFGHKFEYNPNR